MTRWRTIGWQPVFECGCVGEVVRHKFYTPGWICKQHGSRINRVRRICEAYEVDKRRRSER